MMPEFHPAAAEELTAAVLMYEGLAAGLGVDLNGEVKRLTALLCATPRIGEPLDTLHRRFPLQRFPFGLIDRSGGKVLRIVAVAHRWRMPGYWRARM